MLEDFEVKRVHFVNFEILKVTLIILFDVLKKIEHRSTNYHLKSLVIRILDILEVKTPPINNSITFQNHCFLPKFLDFNLVDFYKHVEIEIDFLILLLLVHKLLKVAKRQRMRHRDLKVHYGKFRIDSFIFVDFILVHVDGLIEVD